MTVDAVRPQLEAAERYRVALHIAMCSSKRDVLAVGAGSTVGAQSFVKSDVPAGKLAWGVPARAQP